MQIDGFIDKDEFKKPIDGWIRVFRNTKPAPGTGGPLIPGDPEREAEAIRRKAGIPLLKPVRQDGLFVRPYLISVLNSLRSTSGSEYHKQLRTLMQSKLRLHLRMLIIDFLGGQLEPDDREAELFTPLLESDNESPRILRSIANSPGWFARLRRHSALRKWLSASPELAAHSVPLLSFAMPHYPDDCMELIEESWIAHEKYDALSSRYYSNEKIGIIVEHRFVS